ncbi:DUF4226 domain-containing protein, partial [Mycolicibacterium mageritense]|uniref:DUF4226 domain-containing protein n=1 Tax=Mycolicibacterium mageritense TaxID=53462 RepID=UPI0011D39ADE
LGWGYVRGVTLDLVVTRVAAALNRGHQLFSAAPVDAGAGLSNSSQTLTALSNRISASPASLGAQGQFANAYGDMTQKLSGRLSGTAALDAKLSGLVSEAANSDATGRNQTGNVVNAAAGDTARTGPYTNTPAGQRALLIALRDRVNEQRQVIAAYKARDAKLAALVRQLGYQRSATGRGGGGFPAALSGLSGLRPPTSTGGGGGSPGFSLPNFTNLTRGLGGGSANSGQDTPIANFRAALGTLTRGSSPRDVAAAILTQAKLRGYAANESIACLSTGMQESGLKMGARGGGGAWHGIYQQDTSYPDRDDPNKNIDEFFNRLDKLRAKPGASSDIWKNIFWLQQRPGEPSAEIAYANGRQEYLAEIKSQLPKARALYREIAGT